MYVYDYLHSISTAVYSMKSILLLLSLLYILISSCRPPDDIMPKEVTYTLKERPDFPIILQAKSFQISVGDTIWLETSFTEQELLSKLKGNSSINDLNANFSFNISNLTEPGRFMQSQFFEIILKNGRIFNKQEKVGQLNYLMNFENLQKVYKIKIGFLMKREGVFGFSLSNFSSTQVANNQTDYFLGGGQMNFIDNNKTFYGTLTFSWPDKAANETFFKNLNVKTEADFRLEQYYFFKVGK